MPDTAGHDTTTAGAVPPQPDGARVGGLTIRAVLVLGFGLTVGIWLFAWSYFSGKMLEFEQRSQEISTRYLRAQEQLSAARADVYRASILVRDALLSPNPPSPADRSELDTAYLTADQTLRDYDPVVPDEGRDRIDRLRVEIDALRQATIGLLGSEGRGWQEASRAALLEEMSPRRTVAINIAEELQAINRNDFLRQQQSTTQSYRETQRDFSQSLGLALLGSLGIALFAGLHAGRLEDRLRQQRKKDLQNQQNLQRLSAKLITAQEEERRSIARELHDEVGQVLTAIKVELAVAQHALAASGGQVAVLEDARLITDRALHTVRDLSRLLHPSLLDDMGLPAALDWYLKGYRKRHSMKVDYDVAGMDERLAPEIEVGVYRIIQEALTNIVRHAEVSECSVHLVCASGQLRVAIADAGVGFDASAGERRADQGLGLVGIKERVSQLGGSVRIAAGLGQGTTIEIVLPARLREGTRAIDDDADADHPSAGLERVS